jgi:hypothetical protein
MGEAAELPCKAQVRSAAFVSDSIVVSGVRFVR